MLDPSSGRAVEDVGLTAVLHRKIQHAGSLLGHTTLLDDRRVNSHRDQFIDTKPGEISSETRVVASPDPYYPAPWRSQTRCNSGCAVLHILLAGSIIGTTTRKENSARWWCPPSGGRSQSGPCRVLDVGTKRRMPYRSQ